MEAFNGEDKLHQGIGWIIILALLFLRIPFTILITYWYPPESQLGPAVYQFGTYLLTALLIWWERKELADFHIDTVCIGLIILFKPIQTLILRYWEIENPIAFPQQASIWIWVVAVILSIALWKGSYKPVIDRNTWNWLVLGLLAGISMSVIANLKVFHFYGSSAGQSYIVLSSVAVSSVLASFYQLGFAAISEEPLFRGFLWGYLRRSGIKEFWIWLIQALIFMGAHIYFKDALQFNFWVVVPLSALIFGLFAWWSRSVAPGMLAHAAYNAGIYVIFLRVFDLIW